MNDIVERLRAGIQIDRGCVENGCPQTMLVAPMLIEAAAEIEHLRAALQACVKGSRNWMEQAKTALDRTTPCPECEQLRERVAELYRAQKNKLLSAKSVEYDIGTLQEEIEQLKGAHVASVDALESEIARLRSEYEELLARYGIATAELQAQVSTPKR